MRPPAPSHCLVVGVTGHRLGHFSVRMRPRIRTAIGQVIEAITNDFRAQNAGGELRLVSSLASGADSIAADAALERGWTLDAVLPVVRDGYAKDFTDPGERDDYWRQLAAASALFELPGLEPGDADYERAGRVVLDQCDLLLAVWDGRPARGRGGTEQILSEAIERNIPVLMIDAGARQPPEILWSGFDEHGLKRTQLELIGRRGLHALPGLLREFGVEEVQEADPDTDIPASPSLALAFPLLLALAGVRPFRTTDLMRPESRQLRLALSEAYQDICQRTGLFGRRLEALFARYARADATATHMSQLYRSSFVANFALAASAVLLALAGLALPSTVQPALTLGEVAVVGVILWLTHLGRRQGWHIRWISERHLAERLRCMMVGAQLGDLNVRLESGLESGQTTRRLRQAARALGLPTARVDADYLDCVRRKLVALLDDQIAYHRGAARRMHTLDHRLHRLGTWLFTLSALSSVGVLAFEVARHLSGAAGLAHVAHPLSLATTIASAALPAIGASIYGIRIQGDFAGIAARAFALAEALRRLKHAVENEANTDDGFMFDHLRHAIRQAAEVMGSELADWRSAQQARPLTLPG